jgi:hypothetical protein
MSCMDCSMRGKPSFAFCFGCHETWCSDCKIMGFCFSCHGMECANCDPVLAYTQRCVRCRPVEYQGYPGYNWA